jgi:hypothetical protein
MIKGNAYEPSLLLNHYGLEIRKSQMPIKDTEVAATKQQKLLRIIIKE